MKKRIKLFSTIASLCLAVALMAFGVYAAQSSTLSLTSTVSYVVSGEVNVDFTVKVTRATSNTFGDGESIDTYIKRTFDTKGDTVTDSGTSEDEGLTYTWNFSQATIDADINKTVDLGAYAFQVGAKVDDTITYEVTITNKGAYAVNLEISGGPEVDTTSSVNIAVTGKDLTEIGARVDESTGTSVTYKVVYTLKDVTQDFNYDAKQDPKSTVNFTPTFKVSAK